MSKNYFLLNKSPSMTSFSQFIERIKVHFSINYFIRIKRVQFSHHTRRLSHLSTILARLLLMTLRKKLKLV